MTAGPCHQKRFLSATAHARVQRCSCGDICVTVGRTTLHFDQTSFCGFAEAIDFAVKNLVQTADLRPLFGPVGEA